MQTYCWSSIAQRLIIVLVLGTQTTRCSSGLAEDKSDSYETRMYDVSELIEQPLESPTSNMGGTGGGMGSGGMGGMGYGVGGGPSSGLANDSVTNEVLQSLIMVHSFPTASESLTASGMSVGPDSEVGIDASQVGTSAAFVPRASPVCSGLGNQLIVTADAATQERVQQFLDGLRASRESLPLVRVDVVMVQLTDTSPLDVPQFTEEQLQVLATQNDAYQISLRCENHHTAHMSSGIERSFTASVTPVVGDQPGMGKTLTQTNHRSIGYQPQIQTVTTGITGDLRVDVSDPQDQTRIQLSINLISAPEEPTTVTVADGIEVERLELSTAGLKTVVRGAAGQWMVAGVMPITDPQSLFVTGIEHSHLVTLVRWQADAANHK